MIILCIRSLHNWSKTSGTPTFDVLLGPKLRYVYGTGIDGATPSGGGLGAVAVLAVSAALVAVVSVRVSVRARAR